MNILKRPFRKSHQIKMLENKISILEKEIENLEKDRDLYIDELESFCEQDALSAMTESQYKDWNENSKLPPSKYMELVN